MEIGMRCFVFSVYLDKRIYGDTVNKKMSLVHFNSLPVFNLRAIESSVMVKRKNRNKFKTFLVIYKFQHKINTKHQSIETVWTSEGAYKLVYSLAPLKFSRGKKACILLFLSRI